MSYTQYDKPCGVTLTSDSAGFYILGGGGMLMGIIETIGGENDGA